MDKWSKIKCLAVDVDGVLTDGHIFLDASGEWRRQFFIRDGLGLLMVKDKGYKTAFITTSTAKDIQERAKKLKIDYFYEGTSDKAQAFHDLLKKSGLKADEICYMGDDVIDLPIFELCGISVAPADAHEKVLARANIITKNIGGRGAVRELCDLILSSANL